MAVKLTDALRRRRSVVILTAALAGSAIAVAGCGGDSESGSSAGDVASYVPSASPLYLEVTTDFDGPQWTAGPGAGRAVPRPTRTSADASSEELRAGDVDFDADVKPLLGERAAIAGLRLPDVPGLDGALGTTAPDSGAADDAARRRRHGVRRRRRLAEGKAQQAEGPPGAGGRA